MKYYGSEICFGEVQGKKQTNQFVYSLSISIPEYINIAANYKRELKDRELIDEPNDCKNKILKRATNILISDIENVEGVTIHLPDPRSISRVVVSEKVPTSLKHFLKGICGEASNKEKKVLSIAQDIISLHSNGKKRMFENIGLGLVLKRTVRSKELVKSLNNLGHSVSYDDILRIDTTWVAGICEANNGYSTVSTNIREKIFTQAASDNVDYGQENNFQHVTNTVLYRCPELSGSYAHNTLPFRTTKTLRRPLDVLST